MSEGRDRKVIGKVHQLSGSVGSEVSYFRVINCEFVVVYGSIKDKGRRECKYEFAR